MKAENEIELKLRVLDESGLSQKSYEDFTGKLLRKLGGKNNKREVSFLPEPLKLLQTSYYDTKNMDLLKSKIVYRVRSEENENTATIKTDIPREDQKSDILAQRLEQSVLFDQSISSDNYLEIFKDTPVLDILRPIVGRKNLNLLFTTVFERRSFLIELKNQYKILLCIDYGNIVSEDKAQFINEIELELIEGHIGDLFSVACLISGMIPLEAEPQSKYARGLILSGNASNPAVHRTNAGRKYHACESDHTFETTAKGVAAHILDELIYYKNTMETRLSDYEAVHTFRVLLRHMIAVIELSKPVLGDQEFKEVRSTLKKILKKTAKTREIDIFCHSWKTFIESVDACEIDIAKRLSGIINAYRQYERTSLQSNLHDGSFTVLRLHIEKWIYTADKQDKAEIVTQDVLSDFIGLRDQSIAELSVSFNPAKAKKLHKIRLAVKEKRYILRYFDTGIPENELSLEIERLKKLQDILGDMNDIAINTRYSFTMLPDHSLSIKYREWLAEKLLTMQHAL
jgi:triphosphatase